MPDESPVIGAEIDLLVGNKPEKAKLTGLATASRPLVTDSHGVASFTLTVDTPGEVRLLAQLRNDPGQVVPVTVKVLDPSWNMHLMFGLAGGLGMFLFGMNLGADGLQKIAGRRMKSILGAVTGNTYLGILTGIVVTAIVQSSSATTVMLVGFVNASLMTLGQTLSVIMGANVGTTITVQLIAFDISHWALLLIGVGFFMTMARDRNTGYLGTIALGFGLIFYGMKVMSTAMGPLRAYPAFREVLISFKLYPITAIVGSMLFTSIIQSSGATIGLLVAFASQGLIDLQAAVPLILGAHIGTCITGWIAALGASLEARQTAMLNVVYNLVGTVVFLPFLYDPLSFADMVEWVSQPFGATGARMVANAHMISAILKVIVLLPLADYILRLTLWLMPNEEKAGEKVMRVKFLSDSLLATPELALGNVAREISRMAGHVEFMVQSVPALISRGEETLIAEVFAHEQKVDFLRGQITQYLSRLAETNLNSEQSELMVCYMNVINELEGLGDQVQKVIVPLSRTKRDKQCRLSEEGYRELMRMFHEVNGVFLQSINAFATNNQAMYDKVMASESRVQKLEEELRASHMRRVFERRDQSVQTSAMHLDLLGCLKGIHEQAVRIARSLQHQIGRAHV